VRFGDPECQPLLMRLDSDLLEVMQACVSGRLRDIRLKFKPEAALGVVLAADGYPGDCARGMRVAGIDEAEACPDAPGAVKVFVAGAGREDGALLARGGRVLCVTALGRDLAGARQRAYQGIERVRMDKGRYRRDIGAKGLNR
jgi:phosphoribosylamine--glycine ligase